MNKYNLHLAGGALLATTALVSGSVAVHAAATIKSATLALPAIPAAFVTPTLASQMLTATGSGIFVGPQSVIVDSTANLFEKTVIILNVANAEFDATVSPTVSLFQQSGSTAGTINANDGTAAAATVTVFADRIRINDVTARTWSAVEVSGIQYRNAQSLATAGNSIALSGTIFNSAETATLEGITSKNVVSSLSYAAVEVTTGSAVTISNTVNPQFSRVSQAAGTVPTAATNNISSALLARVVMSSTTAVSTNLTLAVSAGSAVSTIEIKLTHGVLGDAAIVNVSLGSGPALLIGTAKTPGQFSAGTVTFTTTGAGLVLGTGNGFLVVQFNGSTPISNWGAGTVGTTQTRTATTAAVLAAGSGTAPALSRGGMSTQLNLLQQSTNPFQSFIRVTNQGGTSGAVSIAMRNSATGATMGTGSYTSAPIAAGGTLQISVAEVESGIGITPISGVNYDATISGPITGYVQHIGFKADSGVVTDLSSFRNGAGTVNP